MASRKIILKKLTPHALFRVDENRQREIQSQEIVFKVTASNMERRKDFFSYEQQGVEQWQKKKNNRH
jgi:hypothetical protein